MAMASISTPGQIERAIYIDFEGRGRSQKTHTAPDPRFVGVLVDGIFTFTALGDCPVAEALRHAPRCAGAATLPHFLEAITRRAHRESRKIVYWSIREPTVFSDFGFPLGELGFDVKPSAQKEWKTVHAMFQEKRKSLKDPSISKTRKNEARRIVDLGLLYHIASETGFHFPPAYPGGKVGKWSGAIEKMLVTRDYYCALTATVKSHYTRLLHHNQNDVLAMQHVLHVLSTRGQILSGK
ncbi:MAG: hypothetical protein CMO26_22605 [Thiotrichales bacterium]|nr:hypothetical protein [Thiotrichales bacterium]